MTISELLDMQKTGRKIAESMDEIHIGSAIETQHYGKMGIAKAMGNAYGAARGEIGAKFSSAVDRLYGKATAMVERTAAEAVERSEKEAGFYWPRKNTDAVKTNLQIADLFSKLDTSSKSAASNDFSAKLKQANDLIKNYSSQYGFKSSWVTLAGDTDGLKKIMQSWLDGNSSEE
ncbi:MAG: hypothetical protein IJV64_11285 [Oscillospiraceae bacterium]|nr:hypothetical protein [Oscillospiraceae bacterium]